MSRINFSISCVEHENSFITSVPVMSGHIAEHTLTRVAVLGEALNLIQSSTDTWSVPYS